MVPKPRTKKTKHDYSNLETRILLAGDTFCTGDADNAIVARLNAADTNVVDLEIDGTIVQSFNVNDITPIVINAELGNDTFLLDYSNGAPLTLGGYQFIGGGGNDRLETNTTDANFFVFEVAAGEDGRLGDILRFDGIEEFVTGSGRDRFDIHSIDTSISIDGGGGNDVFRIGSTTPDFFNGVLTELNGNILIDGGTGQNRILVGGRGGGGLNLNITTNAITGHNQGFGIFYVSNGGSFSNADGSLGGLTFFGSNFGQDIFTVDSFLETNTLRIWGSFGADVFNISGEALGDTLINTGAGFDLINVFLVGSGDRQVVVEGNSGVGNRSLTSVIGSAGDDQFVVTEQSFTAGNESVQSPSFVTLSGAGGDDNFLIGSGLFRTIEGNAGNDTFVTTAAAANTIGQIRAIGGLGDDVFDLTEAPARGNFLGGDGNDTFFGRANHVGRIVLEGQNGSDNYNFELFETPPGSLALLEILDFGTGANDSDNLVFTVIDPAESIRVGNQSISLDYDQFTSIRHLYRGIDSITVNTGDSNNRITLTGGLDTTINTGDGDDLIRIIARFSLNTLDLELDAGGGANQIELVDFQTDENEVRFDVDESGSVPVTTIDSGVDVLFSVRAVSTGGVFASPDGSSGGIAVSPDRVDEGIIYRVNGLLEDNTFEAAGFRGTFVIGPEAFGDVFFGEIREATVDIFESGTDRSVDAANVGVERLQINIIGTDEADQFIVANNFFSWGSTERVVFDENTTSFNIIGNGGDDQFEINATLAGVTTRLFGGDGDDVFTTGGNLNSLDGAIEVYGGAGEDSFIIDDSLAASAYNYHIDTNQIFSIPGPSNLARPDFAGITFGNAQLENLTLLASAGDDLVRVKPTSTTNLNIVGGTGRNAISLISQPNDGHELNLDGLNAGFWNFDFAYRDLSFEDFEIQHAD